MKKQITKNMCQKTVIVAMLSLFWACGKRQNKEQKVELAQDFIAVKLETISTANQSGILEAAGMVAAANEARMAFKTGGIIDKIYVKEGQKIAKGQLLASLNLTEINAQVQQAQEAVHKAERDLKRASNLLADSIATLEQVQNLSTALALAKQNLQIANYNRGYSLIHAPMAGVLVKKLMNEGELCGPGSPVLYLTGTGAQAWLFKAGVTDKDWARLKIGNKATVQLDAYGQKPITAYISNLSQLPDPTTGQYIAELSLQANGQKLAAGLFGKAHIGVAVERGRPSVSVNALVEGSHKTAYVYVVDAQSLAQKIPVQVEALENDRAYLKDWPHSYNKVITDGSAYLVQGSKVKIIN
jgi:membrane fusion protein, multidrug efflux system